MEKRASSNPQIEAFRRRMLCRANLSSGSDDSRGKKIVGLMRQAVFGSLSEWRAK